MNKSNFNRRKIIKKRREEQLLILRRVIKVVPVLLVFALVFIFLIVYLSINRRFVLSKSFNSAFVYRDLVRIINYDPELKEMLVVDIDGDVILDTASNKGQYPLKNIYDLSVNEKTNADLFKKSLMKNLHLPILSVVDCRRVKNSTNFSLSSLLRCVKNNNFSDFVYLFFLRWNAGKNVTYKNLDDYGVNLNDSGINGFYLEDPDIFKKLEFDFSMDLDIRNVVNVEIVYPENMRVPNYFDDLIKVSGGRVVKTSAVDNLIINNNCEVRGMDKVFNKYLKNVFMCRSIYEKGETTSLLFSENELKSYY